MSSNDGCAGMVLVFALMLMGVLWAVSYAGDEREAEARRTLCLERGGYYYDPGLTFRDETIYCMERPVSVDITPGRDPNREGIR